MQLPVWDSSLINKYNVSGPRYTSYPTALELASGYDGDDLIRAAATSLRNELSLYIHIPFCHQLCYYCGCNKIVTRHQSKADVYLDHLAQEIALQAPHFARYRVTQLHLGGGTPTFLTTEQMSRLMEMLRSHFTLSDDLQQGIEVDPRSLAEGMLAHLREQGFNRISFGIQDFNDEVQLAVNRPQNADEVIALVREARTLGFKSINVDMIYGLPLQTPESFAASITQLIELDPDRVSVFNYAHLPSRFAAQRKIKDADLPSPSDKLLMFKNTLASMTEAGYNFIGMDHFAKPDDELAIAQSAGKLHRNFQGYTTHGECDLLGLGVSAISQIGACILQNEKELRPYYQRCEEGLSPVCKGITLNTEDQLRSTVIKQLICHFELDFRVIEEAFAIDFKQHFQEALDALVPLQADGLVEIDELGIKVSARGILFIRIICMCFDEYMQKQLQQNRFSRVI